MRLGGPAAVVVLVCGARIAYLTAHEQLWGWWPPGLFLGLWGLIVALVQRTERLPYLLLATVAGASLGLGFPPLPTWPLQAFGFGVLLYLTDVLVRDGQPLRRQWWYMYHALVLYNVLATWWVANTALAAGLVANFLNALLMAVPWALIYLARRYMPRVWLAAAVVLWIGFEYLHYNWPIAWPWLALGNSLASTPSLAQWYEYTGVFGGSFYLTVAGVFVYKLARTQRTSSLVRVPMIRLGAWMLIPIGLSFAIGSIGVEGVGRDAQGNDVYAGVATVTAIQPNFEPHYRKFAVSERDQQAVFFQLIAEAPPSDLYALPETSFNGLDEASLEQSAPLVLWSAFLQNATKPAGLLAGLSTYKRYGTAIDNPALRTQTDARGNESYYTVHNTALGVQEDGTLLPTYHKAKLVPGVEFFPFRKALFFLQPLIESLGGTTSGLGVSNSAAVFEYASGIRAAPLICYESIYGDYVREYVQRGANLLVVITNDGWWDNSPGYRQHLQMAQLRAIETRLFVVQAANSGTSAFIDSHGEVYARTNYDEAVALTKSVQLLSAPRQTLYVQWGDVIGWLCAWGSGVVMLGLGVRMFMREGPYE